MGDGLTDEELAAIQRIEARLVDIMEDTYAPIDAVGVLLVEEEIEVLRTVVSLFEKADG